LTLGRAKTIELPEPLVLLKLKQIFVQEIAQYFRSGRTGQARWMYGHKIYQTLLDLS